MTNMMTVGVCQREYGNRDNPGRGWGEGGGLKKAKKGLTGVQCEGI